MKEGSDWIRAASELVDCKGRNSADGRLGTWFANAGLRQEGLTARTAPQVNSLRRQLAGAARS